EVFQGSSPYTVWHKLRDATLTGAFRGRAPLESQYTVGVPIAGLSSLLRFAHENTRSRHRRLRQNIDIGLQFGTEAAALFVRGSVNGLDRMEPKLVALLESWPDAMEVRGFLALLYTQVAAIGCNHALSQVPGDPGGLIKNQAAVMARTSFAGIRNGLSRNAKRFLAANASHIKARIVQLFRSSLLRDETLSRVLAHRPFDLLADDMDTGIPVTTYLDVALTEQPARVVASASQKNVFGATTDFAELDTNSGNIGIPLVLLELRAHGRDETTDRRMRETLEDVVREARTIYDEAARARATSSPAFEANITALRSATSTAHPETRSLHTLLAAANRLEIELPQRVNDRMLMPDHTAFRITSATLAAIELRSTDTEDPNVLQLRQTGHTELLRFADQLQALLPEAPVYEATLQTALDATHELAGHLDPAQTHAPDGRNISRLRNNVNLQLQAWNQPAVDDDFVLELYNGLRSHITRLDDAAISGQIAGIIVDPHGVWMRGGNPENALASGGLTDAEALDLAPNTHTDPSAVAGPSRWAGSLEDTASTTDPASTEELPAAETVRTESSVPRHDMGTLYNTVNLELAGLGWTHHIDQATIAKRYAKLPSHITRLNETAVAGRIAIQIASPDTGPGLPGGAVGMEVEVPRWHVTVPEDLYFDDLPDGSVIGHRSFDIVLENANVGGDVPI
ncbi:hypothetical protein KUM39_27885, partial [Streptomyces sp. J2-1]|uniref:hypothetical protein n=1 Tax=Streptomyces corallincola TaxID=2851888 RepID=UPI001C384308